jgi:HD superfamily phosphohydrolase YqeK
VRAGIRHDRVRCVEVDEAIAYLKKHEPEYLESLGL